MPDVWATITEADDATQKRLAAVLEARGSDPQQQQMRRTFLGAIDFPAKAEILEVGCGTGVLMRALAAWPNVGRILGVDPSPALIAEARKLAAGLPNLAFEVADGRSLPFGEGAFDAVLFDSTLSHVPGVKLALAEARRVLRPGGWLAVFDGDYATATVALGDDDPLQSCVAAMMANSVNDRWLMRRLCALVREMEFELVRFASHGYSETSGGAYMLSVIDRGADMLHGSGAIGAETAAALKAEARRRVAEGRFFGHIAYASLIARKRQ